MMPRIDSSVRGLFLRAAVGVASSAVVVDLNYLNRKVTGKILGPAHNQLILAWRALAEAKCRLACSKLTESRKSPFLHPRVFSGLGFLRTRGGLRPGLGWPQARVFIGARECAHGGNRVIPSRFPVSPPLCHATTNEWPATKARQGTADGPNGCRPRSTLVADTRERLRHGTRGRGQFRV